MTKHEDISNPFEVTETKTLAAQNIVDKNKYMTILFFSQPTPIWTLIQHFTHVSSVKSGVRWTARRDTNPLERKLASPKIDFQPFFSVVITMESLMEDVRKEAPCHMTFADDVVLCAREKGVMCVELYQWRKPWRKEE